MRELYRSCLQREASDEEAAGHVLNMLSDTPLAAVFAIVRSEEARNVRTLATSAEPKLTIEADDVANVIRHALVASRGKPPSDYEVNLRAQDFGRGTNLAAVLSDVLIDPSRETLRLTCAEDDASIGKAIEMIYRLALRREATSTDLELWRKVANDRGRLSDALFGISESPEAQRLRISIDAAPGVLVQLAFEILLSRGAMANEVDHFRSLIDAGEVSFSALSWTLFVDEAKRRLSPVRILNDPQQAYLFGSRGVVNIADWQTARRDDASRILKCDVLGNGSAFRFKPTDECAVSIITSLYRGGAFIRSFLENVTSQTIFREHCELIIIDAHSPENEGAVIEEFCKDFSNIVYKRMDSRIGIYEAWNIAIGLSKGRYITNANVDDCRRIDSLEIQASVLDTLNFVDITYQDILYSFSPCMPFDEIVTHDLRAKLPIISRYNLMEFNSPHNAPMWRKSIHSEIGFFDETLKSASDFDFWLRCKMSTKVFYKVNDPHVAYFVNPEGLSTRPETHGAQEANAISCNLYRKIISPMLLTSHEDFLFEIDEIVKVPLRTGRRYDIVQSSLLALGARRGGCAV